MHLEPFGDEWRQAALIAATNLMPWSKKRIDPESFLPVPKRIIAQDPAKIMATLLMLPGLNK
jgi:hypothetical protein